ncbi:MAG: HD domain-containing protein [Cyanobacteria bacterium]|nr:HD domain-containing protein [Cyanobacteriota bacterium]
MPRLSPPTHHRSAFSQGYSTFFQNKVNFLPLNPLKKCPNVSYPSEINLLQNTSPSIDTLHFSGISHTSPTPKVQLGPLFTQALEDAFQFHNANGSPSGLGETLKATATLLDNEGSEASAIALLLLAPSLNQSTLGGYQKKYGKAVSQCLEPLWEILPQNLSLETEGMFTLSSKAQKNFFKKLPGLLPQSRILLQSLMLTKLETGLQEGSHGLSPNAFIHLQRIQKALKKSGTPISSNTSLTREIDRAISEFQKAQKFHPPFLLKTPPPKTFKLFSPRVVEALEWARTQHQNQIRKDTGAPYLCHLLDVAGTVALMGGSEEALIAAVVHDFPDDANETQGLKDIENRFGNSVASLVSTVNFPFLKNWMTSRESHLKKIQTLDTQLAENQEALKITLADKLHNLKTLNRSLREKGPSTWDLFYGSRNDQVWFYRSILAVLKAKMPPSPEIKQLETKVLELEDIAFTDIKGWNFQNTKLKRTQGILSAKAYGKKLIEENPSFRELTQITTSAKGDFPKTTRTVIDASGKTKTIPNFTPEREAFHQQIITTEYNKYLKTQNPNHVGEKIAHIVTGPMGAGKSCYMTKALADRDKAFSIDADVIKSYFAKDYHVNPEDPAYKHLKLKPENGLRAGAIHQETSYLFGKILDLAIENQDNFIVSYTGRDLNWDQNFIQDLKNKGYKVYVHHIQVSLETSIDRMYHRYKTQGRFTQPELLIRNSENSTDNFIALKEWGLKTGMLDGYSWHYNDVKEGSPPILIESVGLSAQEIRDYKADDAFVLNESLLSRKQT